MKKLIYTFILSSFVLFSGADAAITFVNGKVVDASKVPYLSLEEHHKLGMEAYECENWKEAIIHLRVLTCYFGDTEEAKGSFYYLGKALYNRKEYEEANTAFTYYLKANRSTEHFEEVLNLKLDIADRFFRGTKRHMFGATQLPKWAPAQEEAIAICDEIADAVPFHDLAAQSLTCKGQYYYYNCYFEEAVEAFQAVINRFPKHELAIDAYAMINKVYVDQLKKEIQNPDLIAKAELNTKKFKATFPGEEARINEAVEDCKELREIYAYGLLETARFFERNGKPKSSIVYYKSAIAQFPDTAVAEHCRHSLEQLERSCAG